METDRLFAATWAVAFGAVTGLLAGTVVRSTSADARLQYTLVVAATGILGFYWVLRRYSGQWRARTAVYRFALYFVALFVGAVALTRVVWLVVPAGLLSLAIETVATALAAAGATWLSCLGGVEYLLAEYTSIL